MKLPVVVLLAVVAFASADVHEVLRNSRQAFLVNPSQVPRPQAAFQPPAFQSFQPQPVQRFQPQPVQRFQPQPFQRFQPQPFQAGPFQPSQAVWRILSQSQEQDPAGYYRVSYETENGIRAQEEGTVVQPGTPAESTAKQGAFAYTAPDGSPITVTYVADENGFRAQGDHLPTPPPIPQAILDSLEQNAREEQADQRQFLGRIDPRIGLRAFGKK